MARWQLGDKVQARMAYDEGKAWIKRNKAKLENDPAHVEKLTTLQTEAGELLGIKNQGTTERAPFDAVQLTILNFRNQSPK